LDFFAQPIPARQRLLHFLCPFAQDSELFLLSLCLGDHLLDPFPLQRELLAEINPAETE
jgi:hypothetical protein